jgi:hypothetical protein
MPVSPTKPTRPVPSRPLRFRYREHTTSTPVNRERPPHECLGGLYFWLAKARFLQEIPIFPRVIAFTEILLDAFIGTTADQEIITFDRWLIFIGIVQALIFLLQLFVFAYQALKLHETVKAAAEDSKDMKQSIAEATRSADAMEEFAEAAAVQARALSEQVATTKDTMPRLLRAYVCVNFGFTIPQNQETGYRFEVRLLLINAGQTPAYKVGFKTRADVLSYPLPQDFDFAIPDNPAGSESTLAGHAPAITLTGVVDRLYSEEEVAEIKSGLKKRLYIFGTVTYEDVYHFRRYTNFCFSVIWLKDGNTMGIFTKRHNDAD